MKVIKKTLTILISIVLWIIILLAALYAFTTLATRDTNSVSNLGGFTPMIVESNSMSPTFDAGDLIIIKKCDVSKLSEGDIITFHTIIDNEYALNTHRIQTITDTDGIRSYVTKGDNNDIEDTHSIADGDIVGKYCVRIPKLGKVMNVLSSSTGFLVIIVLPLLLFFIYQVYHLVMVSINLKKAIAAEEAAAKAEQDDELDKKCAEAEEALAEAKRIKAEAEAALAQAQGKSADDAVASEAKSSDSEEA
jgi:signal peptidase